MEFMLSGTATLCGLENNQVATSRNGEPHVKAPALLPKFAKQVFLATLLIEDYESHLWQCCNGNARAHRTVQKANIVDREFQERGETGDRKPNSVPSKRVLLMAKTYPFSKATGSPLDPKASGMFVLMHGPGKKSDPFPPDETPQRPLPRPHWQN
jgi:hypothetical protein